jgi:hypothetical protein
MTTKPKFVLSRQSKAKLASCRAVLYILAERALARQDMPYDWKVTHGHRTAKEQAELYAIGRRGIPGEKPVTSAKPGKSKHNAMPAEAFDLMVLVKGREWDAGLYDEVAEVIVAEWKVMQAEGLTVEVLPDGKTIEWDLVWGRRWGDRPHWEIRKLRVGGK